MATVLSNPLEDAMTELTLAVAQTIVNAALKHGRDSKFAPLLVAVFDARSTPKALAAEDGTSMGRYAIAHGKANGALAMGIGSRGLRARAAQAPNFFAGIGPLVGGMAPNPGGVLIRDAGGAIIGAVGVSGDTGENDELCAIAGIEAAGLVADPGAD
jgi:uncharacterized protein GlcG (DUF336 family)